MCGIAGIYAYHYASPEVNREELQKIRDVMSSRGPDGSGEWCSEDGRVALAHRRLAIIDLSPQASQPMQSNDGSIIISFNGEIYNYQELRFELQKKGQRFRTASDTEVLIHLYRERGERMVHELRGMFAFILWDDKKKIMLLARDPYGIKPLYYADDGWTIRAASQVKALLASDKVSRLPEPAGIAGFFLMGSVPEPYTTYQEIRQVPAGGVVVVTSVGPSSPRTYFSIAREFFDAENKPLNLSEDQIQDEVRSALIDSIRHHLVSDVPVGLFLSGGMDSGALAALIYEMGIKDLRTLTLAFQEFGGDPQDESLLAEKVSRLYKTNHQTHFLTRNEFKTDLTHVLEAMDQPTIDGINTYFVAKAAAETGLKVVLSGLGGDELFGGYPSFYEIPRLVKTFSFPSRIPLGGEIFRFLFSLNSFVHPKFAGLVQFGGSYSSAYFLRRGLFMPWELGSLMDRETAREGLRRLQLLELIEKELNPDPQASFGRVATLEASFYLRNQLLRDADWAGMAHSLEVRTPFVDAWLLKSLAPLLVYKAESGNLNQKELLLKSLNIPLPDRVIRRAKTGFTVPVASWLEADAELGSWRRIPLLVREKCPWARRWAYVVMERQMENKFQNSNAVKKSKSLSSF